MKKPFIKVGFLGLMVIGMSIVLIMVFPPKAPWMMEGFSTPIMAFEFVQSPSEVYKLFGLADTPDQQSMTKTMTQSMIRAMDLGNKLDYIYMVLYSSFLFFFSFVCAKDTGQKRYYAGSMMAVVILGSDIFENIQLLRITAKITSLNFERELSLLHGFTWMKWGGITIVFLILAPYFLKGRMFSKLIAVTGISSFTLSVLAYFNRSALTEHMGLSVALMFIMMIAFCFIHKNEA